MVTRMALLHGGGPIFLCGCCLSLKVGDRAGKGRACIASDGSSSGESAGCGCVLEVVDQVRHPWAALRVARDEADARANPVEQARAGAQDHGDKVQTAFVEQTSIEELPRHIRAAVDEYVL